MEPWVAKVSKTGVQRFSPTNHHVEPYISHYYYTNVSSPGLIENIIVVSGSILVIKLFIYLFTKVLPGFMTENEEVLQEEQDPVMVYFHEVSGGSAYPFSSPLVTRFVIVCKMNNINYRVLEEETYDTPIVEIDAEYFTDPELIEKAFNKHFGIPPPSAKEQELFVAISNLDNNHLLSPTQSYHTDEEINSFLTTEKKTFKLLSNFFLGKTSEPPVKIRSKRIKKLKFNVLFHQDLIQIQNLITANPGKYLAGNHLTSADALFFSKLGYIKTIAENLKVWRILLNDYSPILDYIEAIKTEIF